MQNDLLAQTPQPKNKPTGTAESFVTSLDSYLTPSKQPMPSTTVKMASLVAIT